MIKSNIGKSIKHYRKISGLSQGELANKMKISRQTISSWEVDRTEPSIQDVQEMALIFDCTVNDLLGNYREDMDIDKYLADPDLRRLLLCAGGKIPEADRAKFVDALLMTIDTLKGVRNG